MARAHTDHQSSRSSEPGVLHIQTRRLTLREFDSSDLDNLYGLESLPEVVRYQEWGPRTRDEAAHVLQAILEGQAERPHRRHIELAVIKQMESNTTSADDSAFLGRIGGMVESIDHNARKANLWYAFMPSAQGNGYAKEAMEALIEALGRNFGVKKFEIECDPRNEGSWRLAERLGFEKISEVEKAWESKGEWVGSRVYVKNGTAGANGLDES